MPTATTTTQPSPTELPTGEVLVGDALDRLRRLPTASVDTIATSVSGTTKPTGRSASSRTSTSGSAPSGLSCGKPPAS